MKPLFQTLHGAAGTLAAYSVAVQLGLLDRMDRRPATPGELALACDASERGVQALLALLEAQDIVSRLPDGRYRPAMAGLADLHPTLALWEHLAATVRTGVPVPAFDTTDGAEENYPQLVSALGELWADAVPRAVAVLPEAKSVLDVGAGSARWTIALALRDADCRVTALDLPSVLPVTRRAVARAGAQTCFTYLAGDVFDIPLATANYDLIVLSQLCHLFDTTTCAALIERLALALTPGGALAIIDTLAGGTGSELHELSLYLRTGGGRVYTQETYRRWLSAAGLTASDTIELGSEPAIALLIGRKGQTIARH